MKLAPVNTNNAGLMKFHGDLQRFADSIDVKLELFLKKLVFDLYQLIVGDTPVDTGRARASWNVAIGSPNELVPADIPESDRKERAALKARGGTPGPHPMFAAYTGDQAPLPPLIQEIDGKQVIFITSNLVYISALESGHSLQAPQGMVALNLAAMEASVEAAANEARGATL